MGLFGRKAEHCAVCGKEMQHRHKPKREWNMKGRLCGDCHVDKSKEYYEGKIRQSCTVCGTTKKITDLWEPRWQWDMEGLLCKECFDVKEGDFENRKKYCSMCGARMKFLRYRPKPGWKMDGELCRECWDSQKAKFG
ncbi:multiple Zn finger protein [Cenarchaeum symbiosum A]|uniref:Multiple Zn finger protein n=1 Tax=Cenarchaeum symbiosum (strain A) TaxID=414004 RepID=A0RUM8_CENSY|nr:multiple Zn finger protein [Cenarchaeum symbiosum A]